MPLLRFGDKRQAFSRLAAGSGFMGDKKAGQMKGGAPSPRGKKVPGFFHFLSLAPGPASLREKSLDK